MKHLRFLGAAILLLTPTFLFAQAQGRVKGTVVDGKGAPVVGAKVIVTCPEINNYKQELTTDEHGVFSTLIVDGTKKYLFHVEAPGYQAVEQLNKPLIGGQTLELEFTLLSVEQAREQAEQKMMEEPGYKELREGRDLYAAGKVAEARTKLAEAVALKPELYMAWLQLAAIDLDAGKPKVAQTEAEKCLSIQANYAQCLAVAANAAKANGDQAAYDKYMAAYKVANPMDPAVMYNDVVPLLNQGKFDEAEPKLESILALDPDFPDALYQLSIIKVNKQEYPKAKELLDHLMKVAPNFKDMDAAKGMLDWLKTQV